MKKIQKAKILPLIAVILLAVGVLGFTIAYNMDSSTMPNIFAAGEYTTTVTETFTSPDNWKPCDETPKEVIIKNENTVPILVRVKFEESWKSADGTQDLSLSHDGVRLASRIVENESDWTPVGKVYYYRNPLNPGESVSALKAVKLNCDANFGKDNVCTETATGTVCEKPADEYEGAKYHLKITAQTVELGREDSSWMTLYGKIAGTWAERSRDSDGIDFSAGLSSSYGTYGLYRYRENGQPVYYFRGGNDASDSNVNIRNHVIWAGFCWRIIRTTATGGVKMIYNGVPDNNTCMVASDHDLSNDETAFISGDSGYNGRLFKFNDRDERMASVGYMYSKTENDRLRTVQMNRDSYVFSNNVKAANDGVLYTLDTTEGNYVTGSWPDKRLEAATRYHYVCDDGASRCFYNHLYYIVDYSSDAEMVAIGMERDPSYSGVGDLKTALFANENDSVAKAAVESWFEESNLDGHIEGTRNYEDDLEDAVFCNDRSVAGGVLAGEDADGGPNSPMVDSYLYGSSHIHSRAIFGGFSRIVYPKVGNVGRVKPSLDCTNQSDAFQVSNEQAKLKHKVGLITADEAVLAGMTFKNDYGSSSTSPLSYLSFRNVYGGGLEWTMTPLFVGGAEGDSTAAKMFTIRHRSGGGLYDEEDFSVFDRALLRPVVSLKAGTTIVNAGGGAYIGGSGTDDNPYIVGFGWSSL